MTITFLCPNGHQLSAPPGMAGKTGKCPRCSTTFTVPTGEEDREPTPGSSEVASGSSGNLGSKPAGGSDLFVFLCPNGHRLNGPPSLKGKAGKCPHCGSTFQIPTDDEEPEIATPDVIEPLTSSGEFSFGLRNNPAKAPAPVQPVASPPTKGGSGFFGMFKSSGSSKSDAASVVSGEGSSPSSAALAPVAKASPARIFSTLWNQRTDETDLEIFLIEGEIFAPDFFSEELSTGDFGVFGTRENGGYMAITVVPWESVRRISMQKLKDLPGHLFR